MMQLMGVQIESTSISAHKHPNPRWKEYTSRKRTNSIIIIIIIIIKNSCSSGSSAPPAMEKRAEGRGKRTEGRGQRQESRETHSKA
jgi:hypothetical protein